MHSVSLFCRINPKSEVKLQ